LMGKNLFKADPTNVRTAWLVVGVIVAILGVIATFKLAEHGKISYGLGIVISGAIVMSFANAMPAKTLAGTRKLIEILSFQRFVKMVEKDKIKEMSMKDPTIFGRLLAYAMVLGVADQWAEAFRDLSIAQPDWYTSYGGRPFQPIWFIHDLGGGMRTMQNTMTSRPQPSSSRSGAGGGFSGFSGGFSGGGFGGGGGGSW
jgi:uncharacterized membrane protein